jgi:site-specific DNA recombinase
MMAAKERKASLGYSCGGPANYGYRVVNKRYEINPQEAIVVSRIYDLFNLGHSLETITEILFSEGYRPRYAERFSKSTILAILKNERNYGINIWNSVKKRKQRRRVSFIEFDEVVCEDAIPQPIISKSTFDLAQQMLATKTFNRQRLNTPGYLLTGLIKCSCGASLVGSTTKGGRKNAIRRTYICSARKSKHTCNAKDINADYLETALKGYFNDLLKSHVEEHGIPDEIFDLEFKDVSTRIGKLDAEIATNERELRRLVLDKAKTTSETLLSVLDSEVDNKVKYLDQLKYSLQELTSMKGDFERSKAKALDFDYFHNLNLSREFMFQQIESIMVDANDIHLNFK